MAKLKDGYYKQTAEAIGSDLHVLLAGGGSKALTDFAYKSDLTGFVTGGPYLPLSGGVMSGSTTVNSSVFPAFVLNNTNSSGVESGIRFEMKGSNKGYVGYHNSYGTYIWNSTAARYLCIADDGKGYLRSTSTAYELIHSGNISSYALTSLPAHNHSNIISLGNKSVNDLPSTYPNGLSTHGIYNDGWPFTFGCGITAVDNQTGSFQIAGQWNSSVTSVTDNDYPTEMYIRGRRDSYNVWQTWTRVLTNRNYNSYSPKLDGTGATGTWGISISGDADTLDSYHENSFLRYRDLGSNGGATLWDQIGIRSYHNALPEGLSGIYNFGQVVSLPGNGSRLDIFTNHLGSSQSDGQGGLWWRSGWNSDKHIWRRIIDSGNIGSQHVKTADKVSHSTYYYDGNVMKNDTSAYTIFGENAKANYLFPSFLQSHPLWNDWADVLNFTGYCKWGGTQIATEYNAIKPRIAIRKFNQSRNDWGDWTEFITSGNLTYQVGDWNSAVLSVFKSSENKINNAPTQDFCYGVHLRFHRDTANYFTDLVTTLYSDNLYYRRHTENGYSSWKRLAFAEDIPTSLPANGGNADTLDSIDSTGFFRTNLDVIPTSGDLANIPSGSYWIYENKGATNPAPATYSSLIAFGNSYYSPQLCVTHDAKQAWLRGIYNTSSGYSASNWNEIAFKSDLSNLKLRSYTHTLKAGKATRIAYSANALTIVKVTRTNQGGQLILIGTGYGEEGTVRNTWTELTPSSWFQWSLPQVASVSCAVEVYCPSATGDIEVFSSSGITFTDLSGGLTTAAYNKSLIHTGNIGSYVPTVTNYFWADQLITNSAKVNATPTFGSVKSTGLITAQSGIQIGSTSDIGWYFYNSRICAGNSVARGVNTGSLLVSSAWADDSKVPTSGIYSKGNIITPANVQALNLNLHGDWETDFGIHFNEGGDTKYGFSLLYGDSDLFKLVTRNTGTASTVFSVGRGSTQVDFKGKVTVAGRLYSNEWIQFSNNTGLYWPNYPNTSIEMHIRPNTYSSYGGFAMYGKRGGYSGILLGTSNTNLCFMDDGNNSGLYVESLGKWVIYNLRSGNQIGIGTSSCTANYGITLGSSTHLKGNLLINGESYCYTLTTNPSSNWVYLTKLLTGSSASGKSYEAGIGWHNTGGDGTGALTLVPHAQNSSPWAGTVGLYITASTLAFNGTAVSLNGHTHDRRYLRYEGSWTSGSGQSVDNASGMVFAYADHGRPGNWGVVATFEDSEDASYRLQIAGDGWDNNLYYRNRSADRNGWHTGWKTVIDSGNISSQRVDRLLLTSCYGGSTNVGLWSTIKTGNSTDCGTGKLYEVYNDGGPTTYGEVLDIVSYHGNHWQPQLFFGSGKTGRLYYRNKDYNNNTWGDWRTVAWTADIPTVTNYYWANVPISATSNSGTSPTFANATTTGLLTVSTGGSHCGIKVGNNYINAINGELIIQNNTAIRFGDDSWDYDVWAGLRYVSSAKTIHLGLADKSIFSANNALGGGTLNLPGIHHISSAFYNIKVGSVASHTPSTTGWYTIAQVSGYFNYDIYITGGWNNGMPSTVRVNICNINGTSKITQLAGYVGSLCSQIRLGRVSTDVWDVQVYITAQPGTMGEQRCIFTGFGGLTIHHTSTLASASYSATNTLAFGQISGISLTTDNYTSYLDGRYYTETEVNNLLANYYPITGSVNMSGDNKWIGSTMGGGTDYWRIGGYGSSDNGICKITIGDNSNDKFQIEIADYSGTTYIPLEVINTGINITGNATMTRGVVGGYNNTSYALSTASFICNSWIRTNGATGWYNEDYGGGWYMEDSTWIRNYNSKPLYYSINSHNTYGIGTHRLAACFYGSSHVSILLLNSSNGWGICSNNDGNLYLGFRNQCSASDTTKDSYPSYLTKGGYWYATHYYESSDQRLKENIKSVISSDNVPRIREFNWKSSGERSYGLIAQELEEQGYSELVSTKDDGYKTINYSAALSLIVGKLQNKIKELEAEIENLKLRA